MYSFFNKNSSVDVISSVRAGRLSGTRPISLSHSAAGTMSDCRTEARRNGVDVDLRRECAGEDFVVNDSERRLANRVRG